MPFAVLTLAEKRLKPKAMMISMTVLAQGGAHG